MRGIGPLILGACLLGGVCVAAAPAAAAQPGINFSLNQGQGAPGVSVQVNTATSPKQLTNLLEIFVLLTVLALAPSILILCTSFTRILIVLSFLRQALGVSHIPPNQVMIAMALFLTAFNMMPVWQEIQTQAVAPYTAGNLSWEDAARRGAEPLRQFMLRQTRAKDLSLFLKLSRQKNVHKIEDVSLAVVIPAFIISELRAAFIIGFLLYLPFLVIDMVVASVLLSMGMMMLPPIMISLPFKILLFVLIDGWNLIVGSLMRSFH
jgi:flagellar biosynthesis protein FliP